MKRRKRRRIKGSHTNGHIKMISYQAHLLLQRSLESPKTHMTSHPLDFFLATIYPSFKRTVKHVFGAVGRQRRAQSRSTIKALLRVILLAKHVMLCFALTVIEVASLSIMKRRNERIIMLAYNSCM